MQYLVEHTDTFGGQANYSWVDRQTIDIPDGCSDLSLVRKAKAAVGVTGLPCRRSLLGETIELRPNGHCSVIFITPIY